jgi:methionyl-tRNA formyltransferase
MLEVLRATGDTIAHTEDNLSDRPGLVEFTDMIISYGYRHIIGRELVDRFEGRIINLHISLLPWNRGADPNVWSFLEDTPKGVSIHYIDRGVDTGSILAQRAIELSASESLRSSYDKLTVAIGDLFAEKWPAIRVGEIVPKAQIGKGSYHRAKDLEPYRHLLAQGWETPVERLIGRALALAGQGADAK